MTPSNSEAVSWLQLPGIKDNLALFQDFILGKAQDNNAPQAILQKIELVLEELLLNIMSYAYPNGEPGRIKVGFYYQHPDAFHIRIIDQGQPFDPLSSPDPNTGLSVEQRDVGGLGIHLVRNMADKIAYKRQNGENILDVVFSF